MPFFMPICYDAQILLVAPVRKTEKKITILQKKAVRITSREKNLAHTRPLFSKLKIMPFDLIIKQSKLQFMQSIRFRYAPESFNDVWTLNANREHE